MYQVHNHGVRRREYVQYMYIRAGNERHRSICNSRRCALALNRDRPRYLSAPRVVIISERARVQSSVNASGVAETHLNGNGKYT